MMQQGRPQQRGPAGGGHRGPMGGGPVAAMLPGAKAQDFKGTMEGQTLKGAFTSERGSREATGKKVQ